MEEMVLLDAIERYLRGEMSESEKAGFEELRRSNAEVDQAVVEHHAFLNQLDQYGQHKHLKHQLHQTHMRLLESNQISESVAEENAAPVVQFWNRYKRIIA